MGTKLRRDFLWKNNIVFTEVSSVYYSPAIFIGWAAWGSGYIKTDSLTATLTYYTIDADDKDGGTALITELDDRAIADYNVTRMVDQSETNLGTVSAAGAYKSFKLHDDVFNYPYLVIGSSAAVTTGHISLFLKG